MARQGAKRVLFELDVATLIEQSACEHLVIDQGSPIMPDKGGYQALSALCMPACKSLADVRPL